MLTIEKYFISLHLIHTCRQTSKEQVLLFCVQNTYSNEHKVHIFRDTVELPVQNCYSLQVIGRFQYDLKKKETPHRVSSYRLWSF